MAIAGVLELQFLSDVAKLRADMGKATSTVQSATRRMESAFNAVNKAAGILGASLGVLALGRLVSGALQAQDELAKLSSQLNTSVENLVGWRYAADLAGVSGESLTKGIKTLSQQMLDAQFGLSTPIRTFEMLGVATTDAEGKLKDADVMLMDIADRFAAMEDSTEKTALAVKLFGRAGLEMIPMLNTGAAGLRELTDEGRRLNPITTESARQAEIFNDNMNRLTTAVGGAAMKILNSMLPAMVQVSEKMAEAIKQGKIFTGIVWGWGELWKTIVFGTKPSAIEEQRAWIAEMEATIEQLRRTMENMPDTGMFGPSAEARQEAFARRIRVLQITLDQARNSLRLMEEQEARSARNPGLIGDTPTAEGAGSKGKTEAEKAQEAAEKHNDALKERLALYGQETNMARALYDTQKGAYRLADEMVKQEIIDRAQALDLLDQMTKEQEEAEEQAKKRLATNKELIDAETQHAEQMYELFIEDQQRKADNIASLKESVKTELQLLDDRHLRELDMIREYYTTKAEMSAEGEALLNDIIRQYEEERANIIKRNMSDIEAFRAASWDSQARTMVGMMVDMTQNASRINREMFELNKIATIAQIALKAPEAIANAYTWGTAWGGPIVGAAMGALAAAAMGIQAAAAASATFGSGPPSLAGATPATPVTPISAASSDPTSGRSSQPTTIVNFYGTKSERKLLRDFVKSLNENNRDGSKIYVGNA